MWTPALDDTTPADKIEYQGVRLRGARTRDTSLRYQLEPVAKFTGGTSGEITGLKNGTSYRVALSPSTLPAITTKTA